MQPVTVDADRRAAGRGRWAVAAMFFTNGFLVGSWAPQIPVFLTRLGIGTFTLGVLILLFGLGALVAMPGCGMLMARFGSRPALRAFAACAVFGLALVALAPGVAAAGAALFLFGGLIGGMDVAMNANAVVVERRLRRAVMSSSHGFWSLGGFAGGGLGGLVIAGYGHLAHAGLVTIVAAAIVAPALSRLIEEEGRSAVPAGFSFALPRRPLVYLTGVMALFSMVPEGAVLDWGALYLRQELAADIATAGFAFSAFAGAMALMRFLGDRVRNRFGAVTTLRFSSLAAAVGMLAASLSPWPWLAVSAFALCGFGIANMVPIVFSAAGNQPGISPGAGMSVATSIGYSGILVAPSLIGFAAGRAGFAPVFLVLSALPVAVCLMAELARPADFRAARPAE